MKVSQRCCAQLGLASAFVVLTMSVAALVLVPRHSRPLQVADVGTVAPDFKLNDLHDLPVSLSDYRGQAVVLFFSSRQSPTSNQYEERIERLARSYQADARIKVLAIDIGTGDRRDSLRLRLDDGVAQRSYLTLVDERAFVASRYSIATTPTIVVIDPHGVVRYRGPFDNSADIAFASHRFAIDTLQQVLDSTTVAIARK